MPVQWDDNKFMTAVFKTCFDASKKAALLEECQRTIDSSINAKALANKIDNMKRKYVVGGGSGSAPSTPKKPASAKKGASTKSSTSKGASPGKRGLDGFEDDEDITSDATGESPTKKVKREIKAESKYPGFDDDDF